MLQTQRVQDILREALLPRPDPREGQGLAGIVGGLNEGETAGEVEGLIHIHGGNHLPGHRISPGVAGDHDGKDGLVVEPGLAEQSGEPVDTGGEVGR